MQSIIEHCILTIGVSFRSINIVLVSIAGRNLLFIFEELFLKYKRKKRLISVMHYSQAV